MLDPRSDSLAGDVRRPCAARARIRSSARKVACVLVFVVVRARAAVAKAWQTAMADQGDKYRPEAHYMRGPGPKWRAKHAQVSVRR
jgi:hypothetical protein